MRTLGVFLLVVIQFFVATSNGNVVPEQVFTENGRPIAYPSEEEIVEQLLREEERNVDAENWGRFSQIESSPTGSEYGSDVYESKPRWNSDFAEASADAPTEPENEKAPKRKREGQLEFASFVDPTQNRRLHSEKQVLDGFEKRARMPDAADHAEGNMGDTLFIAVTTVCTAAAVFGMIAAAFVWRRVHKRHKAAQESEYPHYGVTGPAKERSGSASPVAAMDAKLASSAQLYHYQHTKQQIIAMEQSTGEGKGQDSEDSEGEEDEGDFSVYEYPGLAPTGDIEVTNPLFENVASPQTKTDPKLSQLQPRIHQRYQGREDQ